MPGRKGSGDPSSRGGLLGLLLWIPTLAAALFLEEGDGDDGDDGDDGKGAGKGEVEITPEEALELVKSVHGEKGPDGKAFDPKRALRTIRDTRRERDELKGQASKAGELERKLREFEEGKLSEEERRQKRERERDEEQDRLKKENRTLRVSNAVTTALTDSNVKPKKLARALRMVDLDAIKVADDGTIDEAAIKAAVEDLVEDVPELFSGAAAPGDGDGGSRGASGDGKGDMNSRIRAAAGRG